MKHVLILLVALVAASVHAAENLAHEKLSKEEKAAKQELDKLLEECALYPTFNMRIEISKKKLTNTDLVNEATRKVKHDLNTAPKLTDKEIFPHGGDGDMPTTHFNSVNFDKDRNGACRARVRRVNRLYDVQSVRGFKEKVRMDGYALQRKFGDQDHQTLFLIVSQPFTDYKEHKPQVEVGNDDSKPGIEEYDVRDKVYKFETDATLVEYFLKNDVKKLNKIQRQQLALARALIVQEGGAYGENIAKGEYLEDKDTHWQLQKVTRKKVESDAVLFEESDDGSYTVFFKSGSTNVDYIYYEN